MTAEFRVVLRKLMLAPGYVFSVLSILALGIGTSSAVYSAVKSTLFPRVDYVSPERLVRISLVKKEQSVTSLVFMPHFCAYRDSDDVFLGVAALAVEQQNTIIGDGVVASNIGRITTNLFDMLGVPMALGRTFQPHDGEPGNERVVILTDKVWRTRYASDRAVIGSKIWLNDQPYEIVGVLPKQYREPLSVGTQIYLPLVVPKGRPNLQEASRSVFCFARLRDGVTPTRAETRLRTLQPGAELPMAKIYETFNPAVQSLIPTTSREAGSKLRVMYWISLGAAGLLFTVSCANSGSLMLLNALSRRREVGIRFALGSSRWQAIRPLFIEGILLGGGSGLLAALIAKWIFPTLLWLASAGNSTFDVVELDWVLLAQMASAGIVVGILVSLLPVVRVAKLNFGSILKENDSGSGTNRHLSFWRNFVVSCEIAVAVLLLIGAALMVRTFQQFTHVDPGMDVSGKLVLNINFPREMVRDVKLRYQTYTQILQQLSEVPEVKAVSLANSIIPGGFRPKTLKLERALSASFQAQGAAVFPNFIEVAGIPLKNGRSLTDLRPSDPPVVVINQTLSRQMFADQDPIGALILLEGGRKWQVIGVVGDVRNLRDQPNATYYYPFWQDGDHLTQAIVQTKFETGLNFGDHLRRHIFEGNPSVVVSTISSVEDRLFAAIAVERFALTALLTLSALATLVSAIGLYSLLAASVEQRRTEIGIRLALGAPPHRILMLILRHGFVLALCGVIGGSIISLSLSHIMVSLIYGTSPNNPMIYLLVSGGVLAFALIASWQPARRATRTDVVPLIRSL